MLSARKRWCGADWLPVVIALNVAFSLAALVGLVPLDGGESNALCLGGFIAFWAGTGLVLHRHHQGLDCADWIYLHAGQVLCMLAFRGGWAAVERHWP